MPDRPDIYAGLPGEVRELLSGLPSAWDDTMLLAGYPGEYAVIARKKAGKWYIAGINGLDEERDIEFETGRLGVGNASFRLFADGEEDRVFRIADIESDGTLKIHCRARGGFVLGQK